jgi:hypothetical protein
MTETANLEQTPIETVRSLTNAKQKAVLSFARSLQPRNTDRPLTLSLQQLAKLPIAERNQILSAYIPATAQDFLDDPELTSFHRYVREGKYDVMWGTDTSLEMEDGFK